MFSLVILAFFLTTSVFTVDTGQFASCNNIDNLLFRVLATSSGIEGHIHSSSNSTISDFCQMNSQASTVQDHDIAFYHDPIQIVDFYIINHDEEYACENDISSGGLLNMTGSGFNFTGSSSIKWVKTSDGTCNTVTTSPFNHDEQTSGYQINVKYDLTSTEHRQTFVFERSRGDQDKWVAPTGSYTSGEGQFASCNDINNLLFRVHANATSSSFDGFIHSSSDFTLSNFCQMDSQASTDQDDIAFYYDPSLNTNCYIIGRDEEYTCENTFSSGEVLNMTGSGFSFTGSSIKWVKTSDGSCNTVTKFPFNLDEQTSGYQINVAYGSGAGSQKTFVFEKSRLPPTQVSPVVSPGEGNTASFSNAALITLAILFIFFI